MIQVFFAGELSDEEALKMFERTAKTMRIGLARYQQIPRELEAYSQYTNSPRNFFFCLLTIDVGMYTLQSNLDFIENLIQRIQKRGTPPQLSFT